MPEIHLLVFVCLKVVAGFGFFTSLQLQRSGMSPGNILVQPDKAFENMLTGLTCVYIFFSVYTVK